MNQPPPPPVYPPPPPGAPAPGAMGMAIPQKNGIAIAALICSLAGLLPCFFGIPGLVGLILGVVGMSRASRAGGAGRGMALAGIIIGIVGIIFIVVFWLFIYGAASGVVVEVDPVAEKYFKLISEEKYDEAYDMTSTAYQGMHTREQFTKHCMKLNSDYGDYQGKEVNVLRGSGVHVETSAAGTTITIKYLVDFNKKKKVCRTVVFKKSGGTWVIEGDNVE